MADQSNQKTGISNRETPTEEAQERKEHPPLNENAPTPDEASETAPSASKVDGAFGKEG
jgi:hypothetical protein